jgi:small subunit ribosomal protein S17
VGDLVRIEECRPISRMKRWMLVEVLTERAVAEVAPESLDAALVQEMQRSASHAQDADAPAEGEQAGS